MTEAIAAAEGSWQGFTSGWSAVLAVLVVLALALTPFAYREDRRKGDGPHSAP